MSDPSAHQQRRRNKPAHNKEEVQSLVMLSLVAAQLYTRYMGTAESSLRCHVPHAPTTRLDASERSHRKRQHSVPTSF